MRFIWNNGSFCDGFFGLVPPPQKGKYYTVVIAYAHSFGAVSEGCGFDAIGLSFLTSNILLVPHH